MTALCQWTSTFQVKRISACLCWIPVRYSQYSQLEHNGRNLMLCFSLDYDSKKWKEERPVRLLSACCYLMLISLSFKLHRLYLQAFVTWNSNKELGGKSNPCHFCTGDCTQSSLCMAQGYSLHPKEGIFCVKLSHYLQGKAVLSLIKLFQVHLSSNF